MSVVKCILLVRTDHWLSVSVIRAEITPRRRVHVGVRAGNFVTLYIKMKVTKQTVNTSDARESAK